jgi:hypothetical protein
VLADIHAAMLATLGDESDDNNEQQQQEQQQAAGAEAEAPVVAEPEPEPETCVEVEVEVVAGEDDTKDLISATIAGDEDKVRLLLDHGYVEPTTDEEVHDEEVDDEPEPIDDAIGTADDDGNGHVEQEEEEATEVTEQIDGDSGGIDDLKDQDRDEVVPSA